MIKQRSGFTVIELLVAMIILAVLISLAYLIYANYINKAKITIAENVLVNARDNLNLYNLDNNKYPDSINFDNCVDENSRAVFSESFCNQLRNDLSSIDNYSYNIEDKKYTLTARAKDSKHTLITLTPDKITK